MDEENKKRTNIEDLPKAEEELSDDEAKNVQGGLTKAGAGTLALGGIDPSDPSRKMGDGSV